MTSYARHPYHPCHLMSLVLAMWWNIYCYSALLRLSHGWSVTMEKKQFVADVFVISETKTCFTMNLKQVLTNKSQT